MSAVSRLDSYQRRHRWVGLPLAIVYKFVDDQGNLLTAMITYYGFLSLFPLLLLLVTILGFLLHGNEHLQQEVLDSALRQFPVIGDQLGSNIHSFHGSTFAVVVGILGSMYGSLGVAQAAQNALNRVWGVPRSSRPNPLVARLRSLLMLVIAAADVLPSTALSALTTLSEAQGRELGVGLRLGATVLAVVLNVALFSIVYQLLTARRTRLRQVWVGAVLAAVAWQALQVLGTYYLRHTLHGASATYGLFGIVLGLLAWIYLGGFILVFCAEINVVRDKHLWPRSLLTPFTDRVQLTPSDRQAYASYAVTETHKGFESVEVDFDQPEPEPEPGRPE